LDLVRTTKKALQPLKTSLDNVAALSADLEKQMATGGDVAGTFHQLDLAVGNVNTLLEDPSIQKILASSADTSEHLAESAKSVDIALEPLPQESLPAQNDFGKSCWNDQVRLRTLTYPAAVASRAATLPCKSASRVFRLAISPNNPVAGDGAAAAAPSRRC
jgi:ABC-type transporter Mla subunit MlaD